MTTTVAARAASSLAIVDYVQGKPYVLLGRRRADLAFVPGKYVLPGGAVEDDDAALHSSMTTLLGRLSPEDRERLRFDCDPTVPAPEVLALTALRETFEETGHMLARPNAGDARSDTWPTAWQPFALASAIPDCSVLALLARAVTPPTYPRRFDARFFHAPAAAILSSTATTDGEFERIDWIALPEAMALDLHDVTAAVLTQLARRLQPGGRLRPSDTIPYMHAKSGDWTIEPLRPNRGVD